MSKSEPGNSQTEKGDARASIGDISASCMSPVNAHVGDFPLNAAIVTGKIDAISAVPAGELVKIPTEIPIFDQGVCRVRVDCVRTIESNHSRRFGQRAVGCVVVIRKRAFLRTSV